MLKILVTGATGFIGNNLTEKLVQRGHETYGIVRKDSFSKNIPEGLKKTINYWKGKS